LAYLIETLAIINTLPRLRVYLDHSHFKMVTDSNSLVQPSSRKAISPRIAIWSLELENYDYSRPGVNMTRWIDLLNY